MGYGFLKPGQENANPLLEMIRAFKDLTEALNNHTKKMEQLQKELLKLENKD
jgi:predicted patatin/cPLA2 family phospholipase